MAHILITGAAGFIGSHTAEGLLNAGHQVTGIDNFRTGSWENLTSFARHPRWRFQELSVLSEDFEGLLASAKPDAIIHLVGLVSVQESISNPALNHQLNVAATEHVIALAERLKIPRLVYASSAAVYGDCLTLPLREESPTQPVSPYGAAKLQSEKLLLEAARQNANLATVCLRYFNVFGPRQRGDSPYSGVISKFVDACVRGQAPVVFGNGLQTRDFIHVRDLARANAAAATTNVPSGSYNIGCGREIQLLEILKTLRELHPTLPPTEFKPARTGDIVRSVCDPSRFRKHTGFATEATLRGGLQEMLQLELAAARSSVAKLAASTTNTLS